MYCINSASSIFTSESVSEGHPDKVCDRISDAILDACLAQDASSRVACEVFASTDLVIVGGEITTNASIDVDSIVRSVVRDIGYTEHNTGFDAETLKVQNIIKKQSADITMGVDAATSQFGQQGAGDQGMMFGFACKETEDLMPAPIILAHNLLKRASKLRKEHALAWLRPDAKAQVSVVYTDGKPSRIDTVVLSHQHHPDISWEHLVQTLRTQVIDEVLVPTGLIDEHTKYFINPTGRFVIGGPQGDTGLTGRKIIVDTYGGMGRHGGGAFSGKDPSKVDRSGAYQARQVAKSLVSAGLCSTCEVQIAYAIGVPFPVSVMVNTFGTGVCGDEELAHIVTKTFDLSPAGIIKHLDLLRPIYEGFMNYGHFTHSEAPWEQIIPLHTI